ncbi:glycosyltransferase family 39 protein [Streptococcus parauberis]|uniref:glycosyltransferase family 39 protein n=1 Tax=Streptococcus parauberis TaxID=1348 RepID=UPI000CCE3E09|nr:glycosyltransferase family 39 protein [Streptococcus parauberis]PNY19346.1 hypothetical protein ASN86_01207 [Streptococcus parauberis]
MNIVYEKFVLKLFTALMLLIGIYWLFSSLTLLGSAPNPLLFVLAILLMFLFLMPKFSRKVINVLLEYKILIFLFSICFQLLILFSTILMIRSDAAMVFNGAMKIVDNSTISTYLSYNPNNLFLFLYERVFYNLFKNNAIWIMQFLNIFYVNLSSYLLYIVSKKFISQNVADIAFLLFTFLITLTPQFVTMYTDVMVLPIITIQLYLIFEILNKDNEIKSLILKVILLAITTGIGYTIRPTLLILVMAFFIISSIYKGYKQFLVYFAVFSLIFVPTITISKSINNSQNVVSIKKEYAKTPLAFIDLGLTYIGTNQIEFQNGLSMFVNESTKVDSEYDGRYSNEVVKKDIKRRLKEYNLNTFIGHLLYKQSATVKDGSLGWNYKDASKEGAFFINPMYQNHKDNRIYNFFRNYIIYTDRPTFNYYRVFLQIIYIIMIIGFVISFIKVNNSLISQTLAIAVFGGLLFLLIFEGGKSRYMIQFLPQIILLSGIGFNNLSIKLNTLKRFV